jgi:phage baseplate assembly protein gpV
MKKIDLLEPNSDYNAMSLLYSTGALNDYGSFAGEFRVEGEVKLDVINKKYYRTGSQTVEQWESIDEEGMVA